MTKPQLIKIKMDTQSFSKEFDSNYPGEDNARKIMEAATGICLGRGTWEGEATFIMNFEEFGKLTFFARKNTQLKVALSASLKQEYIPPVEQCIFYSKSVPKP